MQKSSHEDKAIIAILVLLTIYVISGNAIQKFKITFLHQSGIVLCIEGYFQYSASGYKFLALLLPPIILAFGYNIKRRRILKNFSVILVYGIANTFISFLLVNAFMSYHGENLKDQLLLSAALVISDNTNVFNLIDEHDFPNLVSILMGENTLNYVSGIILFESVLKHQVEGIYGFFEVVGFGFLQIFESLLIGVIIGLLATLLLKYLYLLSFNLIAETISMLYCAYASYIIAGYLGASEVVSLLFCGIILSQYAFILLSHTAKQGTNLMFATMSTASQAFVFVFIGFGSFNIPRAFDFTFIIICTISIIFSRFFSLAICSLVLSLCLKDHFVLDIKKILVIWLAGTIRGSICFALIETLPNEYENRDLLICTTLGVVVLTNILITALLPIWCKLMNVYGDSCITEEI